MHDFIVSALNCDFADRAQLARFTEDYRQIVSSTAMALDMADDRGILLLEDYLDDAACTPEQRVIAHFWRSTVLRHARRAVGLKAEARRRPSAPPAAGMSLSNSLNPARAAPTIAARNYSVCSIWPRQHSGKSWPKASVASDGFMRSLRTGRRTHQTRLSRNGSRR